MSTDKAPRHEDLEYFRFLADSPPLMIGTTDTEGNLTYVSKRWLELTGTDDVQNAGKHWLSLVHPEDVEKLREDLEYATSRRLPYCLEYRLKRADGTYRWIVDKAEPRHSPEGEFTGYIGTAVDVTEIAEAREEGERIEKAMEHAQRLESIGLLAGGIAHDFNNILEGILGNVSLALHELADDSPVRSRLRVIEDAAMQASDLTRQLLAFSGKGNVLIEPCDLSTVVREMSELLKISISKDAELELKLVDELPQATVDVGQVRQIILNLVINASDALNSEPGRITVSTREALCSREFLEDSIFGVGLCEGVYVCLEVADTGSGLDRGSVGRIFDPFFTTKLTGRGLGLAAVSGILRAHKGTATIDTGSKGTIFRIYLPSAPHRARSIAAKEPASPVVGKGIALIVDDEDMVRLVTKEMLSHMGFETLEAKNGRQAIEVYRENSSDISLVFLDMTMPMMSGEETLRELRKVKSDISVILSSGYNEQDAVTKLAGEGQMAFLQKPFRMEDLAGMLGRLFPEK